MIDTVNNQIDTDNRKKPQSYFRLILYWLGGTGLLTNAIYIFGLGYYEGYINGMGFRYELFPLDTHDAFMWAYSASRRFAVDVLENFPIILLYSSGGVFLIVWTFFSIFHTEKNLHCVKDYFFYKAIVNIEKKVSISFFKYKALFKFIVLRRKTSLLMRNIKKILETKYCRIFIKILYYLTIPIRFFLSFFWFVIKFLFANSKSVRAVKSSYIAFWICYILTPIALLWYLFPWLGIKYGNRTAAEVIQHIEKRSNFCQAKDKRWQECIVFNHNEETIEGMIIIKVENKLALFTKNGPLTITEPSQYQFYTKKNMIEDNNTNIWNDSTNVKN